MAADYLITGAAELVTCSPDFVLETSDIPGENELGIVSNGALAVASGTIVWIGSSDEIPEQYAAFPSLDVSGKTITPGFVDCHTHCVYGGSREHEYTLRALGKSYQEIAVAGGGIKSTVKATRKSTEGELYESAKRILWRMMQAGTSFVEIKSGYGLETETELRQLEVIARLGRDLPLRVVPTFLGAHEVPTEFLDLNGKKQTELTAKYLELIENEMLPAVAKQGIARFCDVFCEQGVFTADESRRVLAAGCSHGLTPKLHAEELSYSGGTEVGVELSAASVDHLAHITEAAAKKLVAANGTAVLLPGTMSFLGSSQFAPARMLLEQGCRVALATDCNPGSCTAESLSLIMTLAVSQMKMTPAEALLAVTTHAAYALRAEKEAGMLAVGRAADIAVFDCSNYQQIPYRFGVNQLERLYIAGNLVVEH